MLADAFTRFARWAARAAGHPAAFMIGVIAIVVWGLVGPLFGYSDTWQLVINTGTTIVTFLMVFLIQNTQNRDTVAMQVKLDELIRAVKGAHNRLLDLEEMDETQLEEVKRRYRDIAEAAKTKVEQGGRDGDVPPLKVDPQPEPSETKKPPGR